ncbi:MAG: BarA sensory histidine kinase (VarS GacS) [uncultured Solirubrobacteraceae bacterium]|uniref:histidine kinase n=1 Tax=uncultured Solirubrobacteraceae bacterium TaxID=1162706 RepID=A0A6J4SPG6_9ACTN|nr:MAG: BarA sensory histidine kinase (VarS GacS) [uncultured Solirubrobacteraceae bacterium]
MSVVGLAGLLTIIPLLALVGITQNQAERTVRAEARAAAQTSARAGANAVAAELRGLQDVIRAYAQRRLLAAQLRGNDPREARVRRHLRQLAGAREGISTAWALDARGRLVDIIPATPEIVGRSFTFRDYYRGARRTGGPYVSEAFVVASRNRPLSVAVADLVMTAGGERAGMLVAGYDLTAIERFIRRYAAAERVRLTVTDQRGIVVAGPGGPSDGRRSLRDDPLVAEALAGRSGTGMRAAATGEVLAASVPVTGVGWTVTAEVDEAKALSGVTALRRTQSIFGIPLGLALLAGIVLLSRALHRRAKAEEALRLSEERALGIVRSSPDAFVALDQDGAITAWNPAAERMFGWPEREAVGRALSATIVPPHLREAHDAGLARFVRTRQARLIGHTLELPAEHRDGHEIPIELSISAIDRADGISVHAFIRDVSKRKRSEEALREAHARAVEASRLKSEFVANMSHELRTPLNGVIGMTDLLLQSRLDDEQRQYADMARRAGEGLLSLISDVLDFSKIEAGKLELDEIEFDLRDMIEDACEIVAEAAFAKGLELLPWVDAAVPARIRGDDARLRQVLINLVGNAVKFTEEGEVLVRVTVAGERLRFEVTDTGIGIPAAQQERLWEAFTQADASTTRQFGGTGLGLAICRQLATAMDGTIAVESEPGRGSTFSFEIPLQAVESGREVAPRSRRDEERSLAGQRVLVVDDNATNRAILEAQLSAWGVRVTAVDGGEAALDALRSASEDPFALALLDFAMPGLNGVELAQAIRSDPGIGPVVLALLTSSGGERTAARDADIRLYLTKPVRHAQLRAALVRVLFGRLSPPPEAFVRSQVEPAGFTVLVAEDNPVNQLVARATLERLGFRVDVAPDGEQAVAMSAAEDYAAIFMDCQMPRLDGYSATAMIRRREDGAGRRTPIVAMTAHALKGDRERCLAAGMDDYLAKPLDHDELQRVLREWVARAAADTAPTVRTPAGDDGDADDAVDASELDALRALHSGPVVGSLVALFAEEAPARIADMSAAAEGGDGDALSQAAHRLKSSCRILGAVGMEDLCAELERRGGEGDVAACEPLVARLAAAHEGVRATLRQSGA